MKTKTIIVSAPSGAGKSSFVERLVKEDARFYDVITYTTRPMRRGESQGSPYHYVSPEYFHELKDQDFFVEWAQVHTNFYGTPWDQIKAAWSRGQCVIMDLDIQGAQSFREKLAEGLKTIFILPPSIEELRRRIVSRDGKVPADLDLRMSNAAKEMAYANQFDVKIVNQDFEPSYAEFKKTVASWVSSV